MEFSVEMIARATLENLKITEIPTNLNKDGRKNTKSHLKTWEDGWRHLVFMLLYSPRWLFYYTEVFFFSRLTIRIKHYIRNFQIRTS